MSKDANPPAAAPTNAPTTAPGVAPGVAPALTGDPFASSLAGLEAHVAAAELAGEPVSPRMREMLERLRELSGAVSALTESLGRPPADAPGTEPGPR